MITFSKCAVIKCYIKFALKKLQMRALTDQSRPAFVKQSNLSETEDRHANKNAFTAT